MKIRENFGISDSEEGYDDVMDEDFIDEPELYAFPTGTKAQIALATPVNFDQIEKPAMCLRSNRAVLLNFHRLDKKTADNARFFLKGIIIYFR